MEQKTEQPPQQEPQHQARWRALWEWTGFNERKLWDWLELLISASIPLVIAIAGFLFTSTQQSTQQEIEEQRAQDEALQTYIQEMGNLLLEGELLSSVEGDEARTVARARTLTLLSRVDGARKRSVVQFLYESNLIGGVPEPVRPRDPWELTDSEPTVVSLAEADLGHADLSEMLLSAADLSQAKLRNADLSEANLSSAVLREADLREANLSGARLSEADLGEAFLNEADLSQAYLSEASLFRADLSEADLRNADLSNADLSDADLREADLRGADLSGADLSEADLSGATRVTEEELAKAKTLEEATMPDWSQHD